MLQDNCSVIPARPPRRVFFQSLPSSSIHGEGRVDFSLVARVGKSNAGRGGGGSNFFVVDGVPQNESSAFSRLLVSSPTGRNQRCRCACAMNIDVVVTNPKFVIVEHD